MVLKARAEQSSAQDDARLDALDAYRVLDTPEERGFDDIVTLATQLCDTSVALVSLVDRNRQWFKARRGFEPCETDLDSSVCRHALGRSEILEIADLTIDPRTMANPLVTDEPFLRFYAGAPLNTADGQTLGTLCVIDHVPRPGGLTEPQRTGLRALANQVMSQLDLRRALAERDAATAELEAAMREREADRKIALAEAARLEAMIATQQAVAAADADLGSVFQAVVDGVLRVIDHADGAVVELKDGDELVYDTVSGSSERHKGIRLPLGKTFSGRAVLTERPMHCADTATDAAVDHALAMRLGIRSMIVVPVTRRGKPIGALKVQSGSPDVFSPRDVVMAQMLAGLVASAFGDVAEVKSKRALREAETRYRQTFESVTEFGIVVTDLNCVVTEWNTGAERIFGWKSDEIIGRDAELFFTPEDRRAGRVKVEMRQAMRDGQAVDERWHLRKDGTLFYASGNMMPLRGEGGEHLGFIKVVRDRTEQHLAGVRLREMEEQLLQAQEVGGVGTFTVDIRADRLEATPAFSRLFGIEHRDGRRPEELEALVVPEDRSLVSNAATRGSGEAMQEVEYRIRRADTGEIRWLSRKAETARDENGLPARFTGLVRDITARKGAEEALAASEAKWRGLFEDLQEGFILGKVIRDEAGRIVDWRYEEVNRAWGELTGLDPSAVLGRAAREVLPDIEDEWVKEFGDVVQTGVAIRFTRQVGTLDRWYDGVCQPAGDDCFTVIFLEVTDRVRSDRRREALAVLGEALLRARDPDAMSSAAAAIIGWSLDVGRVGYGTLGADGETFVVPTDWTQKSFPSLAGTYRISEYGLYADDLRQGRMVVIPDILLDPRTSGEPGPLEKVAVRTLVNHPIVENGRTVAILYVNDDEPRAWTKEEVTFVQAAGDLMRFAIQRRRAEEELRDAQERLRLAVEAADIGTFDFDPRANRLRWDERTRTLSGLPEGATVDWERFVAGLHPDDRERVDAAVARSFDPAGSGGYGVEYRTRGLADGVERWLAAKGQTFFEDGRPIRFVGTVRDISPERSAEQQLAAAEEPRRLATDVGEIGLWELDLVSGELSLDARMRLMNGVPSGELDAAGAFAAVHPEDRARLDRELKRLSDGAIERLAIQYRVIGVEDGIVRTVEVNGVAVRDAHGRAMRLVGAARDVSDRVAADERRRVLNGELAHRLKNNLALVSSIVTQTLRNAPDVASARTTLLQRIQALSKAHDVLMTGQRDAATVGEAVRSAVSLHDAGDRVRLEGADIALGPKASLTLALICHELATNAGKYGALSVPEGRVIVSWSADLDPQTGHSRLVFDWRERGGPPVTTPARRSFGTRLIEMGLSGTLGGSSELTYAPEGVQCRLTAALAGLQTSDEPEGV